ncbi:MAG: phosphoribosylaminoimidazolesuccinocarboxamide synthase [Quinella sp. 3Q1]|nr:phosphoribosylaminoimidazolesuccinocarboxamide synthase [Quinella sp. 3Q1]MBR3051432.1 phosphoribosylaminoimidazolesuccinocarboxamide synthase [Selenomonadaceae bacterium]MBR6888087.1 phosphoribosylaminoimidazolesuccinocarboxamide synthase [Selenomonadaceae bacterium]
MIKGNLLYEGKAKKVFETDNPNELLVYFKDDATAFNGEKHGTIADKGVINNKISAFFFKLLKDHGIKTHFIETVSAREMLIKKLDMIKLEIIVRNIVAGSLVKRLGLPEGTPLVVPVIEYDYKSDELGDPMLNRWHIMALNLAKIDELNQIEHMALATNTILREILKAKNVDLIDFKLEFGRFDGEILLADEISPDNCRFWDTETHEKLDKDRFRHDLGGVEEAYQEMLNRLTM